MSDDIDHLHMAIRGHTVRGVVQNMDDTGGSQTMTVGMHYGTTRSQVPVHYPFGFGAYAPLDGAVTHVIANGGDPSDLIALPPSNPSVARMGNLQPGESVLYDAVGQKVYLMGGKIVRIDCLQELQVRIAGTTVLDVTEDGVAITGSLSVSKDITTQSNVNAQGDVKAGNISLQQHKHPVSGSETGSPNE